MWVYSHRVLLQGFFPLALNMREIVNAFLPFSTISASSTPLARNHFQNRLRRLIEEE